MFSTRSTNLILSVDETDNILQQKIQKLFNINISQFGVFFPSGLQILAISCSQNLQSWNYVVNTDSKIKN